MRLNKGEKYHLIQDGVHKRLIADREFYCHGILIKVGQRGGRVENSESVSQSGSCWVTEDAYIMGKSTVRDDALVTGNAIITGGASICHNAHVEDDCQVSAGATIRGNARISGSVAVSGKIVIGRDMSAGVYSDINGKLFPDVILDYTPKSGQLHINNYAASRFLNINIKACNTVKEGLTYCQVVDLISAKEKNNG